MKILVLSNLMSYTYNFRLELLKALKERGDSITVVCEDDDENKTREIKKFCTFINVPFNGKGKNPLEELSLIRKYSKIIKEQKSDFILSFTIKMNLYGGLCARHSDIDWIPMITGLGELEKEGRLRAVLMFLHRLVMPHARCVFFQNEDNRAFFIKNKIGFKNSLIVPGSGINLDFYKSCPYPASEPVVFTFIGRLTKAKGIEEFLAAAERLSPKARFTAAGKCDEEYLPLVKRLVSEGRLDYRGMVSDSRELLAQSHCLVLPTYHPEGMSNVLLEASATARPAICTSRTGTREIIRDGINGLYCREKDADNLCSVLLDFIAMDNSKREEMGKAGRKTVEEKFDRALVVKAYLSQI